MVRWSEAELLAALGRQEEAAFAHLYDTYATGLLRLALSLTGSHAVAEEAVQEVFVSLVHRGDRLLGILSLRSYLYTAVRNCAWRQRDRWKHQPLEEQAVEAPMPSASPAPVQSNRLEKALGALPEEQRQVILLKIDGDLTFEELGAVLHLSPNTVASRYRYGMEKLRQWMNPVDRLKS